MIDFVTIAKSTNIFKIFKIRVFPDFRKNWIPDLKFFGQKSPPDQDGAYKKKFSQIGPAVPEEIGHKHTRTQTSCCYMIEINYWFRNGHHDKHFSLLVFLDSRNSSLSNSLLIFDNFEHNVHIQILSIYTHILISNLSN